MICVVLSNYFSNNYFGVYSSPLRAREAILNFASNDENIRFCFHDAAYGYVAITNDNKTYRFDIYMETIDS